MLMLKEILSHSSKLVALALVLGLAGCGGGGSGGGGASGANVGDDILCGSSDCPTGGGSGSLSDSNIGSGSGDDFVPGVLATDLDGSSLSLGESAVITATIVDEGGDFVTERTSVTFDSTCVDSGLATLSQLVVTTTSGTASVTYTANGCEGADIVSATAGDLTASVTLTVEPEIISVGNGSGDNFVPEVLAIGIGEGATLSAGGQTTVSFTIANQNGELQTASAGSPIEVAFSSGCVSEGLASFSQNSITTVTGGGSVVYSDQGCGEAPNGTADTILATALGSTGSVDIIIAPDTVNSIEFVAADPAEIFITGSGGQETSNVTFRVEGQLGGPVVGAEVDFELTTEVGGLSLAFNSAITNSDGEVTATVQSGTVPTPVRVVATERSTNISTLSDGLSLSTGVADADNFSVVAETLNPECWTGLQGGTVGVTAFVGDVFNNPVPDGSVVQFTTEGGLVSSSCQTTGGSCSVTFTCTPPFVSNGRITILGYTVGAESFVDQNTNGVFDAADSFPSANDLPEAFRDDDEDGSRDSNEIYIDFNANGSFDSGDGVYTGVLCPGGATSCNGGTINVFDRVVIAQSNPSVTLLSNTIPSTIDLAQGDVGVIVGTVRIGDSNGNSLPEGTSFSISATNGEVVGGTSFTVANTTGSVAFSVAMSADEEPSADGVLEISVTVPGYAAQSFVFAVDDN